MIDGDGYYSASIIYQYLKKISPNLNVEFLLHKDRIHGLKDTYIINKILQDKPKLLICPDSASADYKQCKLLKENSTNVLILDHHPTDIKNDYAVVINNKLSPNIVNKSGSGALVTWKFCKYLDGKLGVNYAPQMIDLVWFSLLSDICDMNTLENRAFSYWGSKCIRNKFLVQICDKILKDKPINNHNISWYVQPKISDIIRCDNEEIKKDLLYSLAEENQECIDKVLDKFSTIHNHRKKYVQEYFENMDYINENNNIIFEKVENLYPYYTGLVGSKINDKYNKPCILYREPKDELTIGSVRSPYPIKQQLKDSGLFEFVEGHDSALGVGIKPNKLSTIQQFVKDIDLDDSINVTASFNANEHIPQYLFTFADEYEELWSQGISKPQYYTYNIRINSKDIKQLGKNKTTIKFHYNGIDYIKFFVSHEEQDTKWFIGESIDLKVEVIGEFGVNEWNNRITPQILINDFEVNKVNKKALDLDIIYS